ncbi:hypothetical protein FHR95_000237 [Halomonas fontilapidosi]|uniref:Uncharacterized protein n=1 Tax=Halomonas fontilapidosi TaxID=616675 RepID=A0A7W5DIG0_9GAMM|nr:hypothetical protein [Halomonas fontilapidosi]MBB3182713.1 hypothetical protein [Halomonas fontilapidosi]
MTDRHSTTASIEAADLIQTLAGYAERYEREHGRRLEAVTLPRATWLALGKPEMVAGVRITPADDIGAPVPRMSG